MDTLSSTLIEYAVKVVNLLPESPFVGLEELDGAEFAQIMAYVNWFIPFGFISRVFGAWLGCVAVYQVIQVVLRWLKVVQ